jgi:hypothetical protein
MKQIKRVLILNSLLVTGTAYAQAVAVLPTAPNPPAIVTSSPNEVDAASIATTNKVYIDQSGQGVNVNIQQTGTSNIIGTLADPIYLRGDNQTVTAVQTGTGNSLLMSIIGAYGQGSGTTTTVRQIGDNNTADIRCGSFQSDNDCNGLNLNAKFTGNNNDLSYHGSEAGITSTIDMLGNNNDLTLTINSPNASQTLLFDGDFNNINVTQSGAGGTYGHSLLADFTGSNNTLTTQQYGASETIINIRSVGANGVFNIKSGH